MQTSKPDFKTSICPYLGLKDDPGSYLGNPSPGNHCHHCQSPAIPLVIHQETYCLTSEHPQCVVYAQMAGQPFPRQLQEQDNFVVQQNSSRGRFALFFLGAVVIILLGWQLFATVGFDQALFSRFLSPPTVNPEISLNPTATSSPTLEPTPTPVPTLTPLPSPTAAPQQRHALETPILVNGQEYLIHVVMAGEGFDYLAKNYRTSIEVIRAINYSLPSAIWVNLPLVISPGVTIVDPEIPAFQAYQVIDAKISLDDLAKNMELDAELLKQYNACPTGCNLEKGDWLILPQTQ